jgi:hypothetical protein
MSVQAEKKNNNKIKSSSPLPVRVPVPLATAIKDKFLRHANIKNKPSETNQVKGPIVLLNFVSTRIAKKNSTCVNMLMLPLY